MKLTLALLLGFSLFVWACKKDKTVLNLTVVDKETKLPIGDVAILIRESVDPESAGAVEHFLTTNSKGELQFSSTHSFFVEQIRGKSDKYVPRILPKLSLVEGEENDRTIELLPYDCQLTLKLHHKFASTDRAYYYLYNKSISDQFGTGKLITPVGPTHSTVPTLIPINSLYEEIYQLRSNEYSYIYIDTLPSTATHDLILRDSIILSKGDSKSLLIEF